MIAASLYQKQEKLKRNKIQNNNKFKIKNNLYYINHNENYINKEINVPYFITTICTFTKNGYRHHKEDIYFKIINGLYLCKHEQLTASKITGILRRSKNNYSFY